MATRPDLRVSDADREATAASLREHFALGRLSLDEFNQRLSAAFAAVTQRDLDAVTGDLPHVRTPAAPLPVAGFTAGQGAGGSGGGRTGGGSGGWTGGQSRAGSTRRGFGLAFGMISSLAVLLLVLTPFWLGIGLFGGVGRWGILTIGLLIIRSILRRLFGLRRWPGACSGRGGHYTGYGRNRGPW
jgi:hypothetical protein